jgi:hypothetical protein
MCVTIFSLHLKKQHFYRAFFSVLSSASKRKVSSVTMLFSVEQRDFISLQYIDLAKSRVGQLA